MSNIIEINTDKMIGAAVGNDLFANRASIAEMQQQAGNAEVSIIIQGYNGLDKTKRCVESVLEYTKDIDYELILIDNGSTDGTFEYFKSVTYDRKIIYHITKNIGSGYPSGCLNVNQLGRFICLLAADLIVTSHWMENILTCFNSDPKIGMVNPVSSNTSNFQCVEFSYDSYEEMQAKAAKFNQSNPRQWEDRVRLVTLGTVYRKEVLLAGGWLSDQGYFHDFMDDDLTFKIRSLGYRAVLVGDTWICHDHKLSQGEGKDPVEHARSLEIGRANFREKHFGIDAWTDASNYLAPYVRYFPKPKELKRAHILGVDTRCGTPALDIKNWLRKFDIYDTELSAFTQDAKYWFDLKTICKGTVACDREEFLQDYFPREYFDYVIVDRPINRYHEPQKILNGLFELCKKGGIVICKLKNTMSFQEYIHMLGQHDVYDPEFSYNIPYMVFVEAISKLGTVKRIVSVQFDLDEGQQAALDALLPLDYTEERRSEILKRMSCQEYLIIIEKD